VEDKEEESSFGVDSKIDDEISFISRNVHQRWKKKRGFKRQRAQSQKNGSPKTSKLKLFAISEKSLNISY